MNKPMTQADIYKAIEEIDEIVSKKLLAIEQAEKQVPVAYKYTDKTNPLVFYFTERKGKDVTQNLDVIETALYTAPPRKEWVGLTDEEILSAAEEVPITCIRQRDYDLHFAPIIEAKLKEKNGG
jgi:hypothetical protein